MTELPECIKQMAGRSAYELVLEYQDTNQEHQRLQNERNAVFEKIGKKLGNKKLLLQLESLENQISSKEEDLIYLKGMIDCAVFLKAIRLL